MIELKLMRQYVAVAETLNFRNAAQRLNMSQPPLSAAIQRLEQRLGVQLLQRNTRKTQLTQAGNVFLIEARQVLQQAERACKMARDAAAGIHGTIRLGFVDSIVDSLLAILIGSYRDSFPHVELQLQEATPPEQIESLRNDHLDLGLLVLPSVPPGNLFIEPICEDKMVAVMPHDHILVNLNKVHLSDLASLKWILLAEQHNPEMYSQVLKSCHIAGFTPEIIHKPRQMQTTAALVSGGLGITLMPEHYARRQPERLVYRELTGPGTPIPYVLSLAYKELSPCATEFRKKIIQILNASN